MHVGDFLKTIIDDLKPKLDSLDPDVATQKHDVHKWSKKEILGHLIDSASCNHHRFVLAKTKDNLVFDGYDQDHWVAFQHYQGIPWNEIVALWYAYNVHLYRVMHAVPEDVRQKVHLHHNLDQIAMRAVPRYAPATLDYLMRDYIWHLEHHMKQILPDYIRQHHW